MQIVCHFEFEQLEIFQGISHSETTHILLYGNGQAIWHGFPDHIMHI